ncbi:amino acid permease, partial [Liquorilactobacillus uvarum]
MNGIFRKKRIDDLLGETTPLKRTLHTLDLTFLGIGAIIGTGIFVLTGKGALTAGPALSLSFLLAAICCGFAGLCYAEFASMAPVAGSAYTYSYVAFGEVIAFIIGWDLILEYALGAATVSVGWSGYFVNLLDNMGIHIPTVLTAAAGTTPGVSTIFNLPAFLIVLVITWIISIGIN